MHPPNVAHRWERRPAKAQVCVAPLEIVGGQRGVRVPASREIRSCAMERLGDRGVSRRADDNILCVNGSRSYRARRARTPGTREVPASNGDGFPRSS